MQTSQLRIFQIILTIVGVIALASLYILRFQDIQLAVNQDSIIRFIGFACLAVANYLNYRRLLVTNASKAKPVLWLSILLGFIALATISRLII